MAFSSSSSSSSSRARMSVLAGLALLGLAAESGAQTAAPRSRFRMHVFPWGTVGVDVNARGRAVARDISSYSSYAWRRRLGVQPLAPANGLPWASVNSLDSAGIAVGFSRDNSQAVPTIWSPSGVPLAIPGAPVGGAVAINDAGVIVGMSDETSPPSGWMWDAAHGVRPLSDFGLPAGKFVSDLSASGYVVGGGPSSRAFRLDLSTSTYLTLGTATYSGAYGVNEKGHVVGWFADASLDARPFLWTPSGGMQPLDPLMPSGMFLETGWAHGLNDDGDVVGEIEVSTDFYHAFLWSEPQGMRDLNTLVDGRGSIELLRARRITDTGWIVGEGQDHSVGGAWVGFVLEPLP